MRGIAFLLLGVVVVVIIWAWWPAIEAVMNK